MPLPPAILAYLRLLRVGTLFSPGADVLAGLCLAGAASGQGWRPGSMAAMAASICVYAAGMVWNDHADRHEDARRRPERPIPSRGVAAGMAFGLGCALAGLGLLLAPSTLDWGVLVALVFAYDYLLKRWVLAGALTMGVLRAMNLCIGALALFEEPLGRGLWIAALVYGIYIVAVTLLAHLEDEAPVEARVVTPLQMAPPLACALAILAAPNPWPATGIGLALALLFAVRVRLVRLWDRDALRASVTWLLLGTMLYTGLLCLAAGRGPESLAILLAALAARWISRRIALT